MARHANHAWIAPIYFPELRRTQALQEDLDVLHDSRWAQDFVVEPACARYVAHVAELNQFHPELLVAHAYVRYMGDLSGGQILCRMVAEALGPESDAGVKFYQFEGSDSPTQLAHRFRAGLDSVPAPESARKALVAEANFSFHLHIQLFEELATRGTGGS